MINKGGRFLVKNSKRLCFKLDVFLAAIFLIIPMIPYLNHMFRGLVFTWSLFPIWIIVALHNKKDFFEFTKSLNKRRSALFSLLLFIFFVAFNYFFIRSTAQGFQYLVIFVNILFIFILDTFYSIKNERERFSILFFIIVSLGIQAFISIPHLLSAPGYIARQLTSGQLEGAAAVEAMKKGIAGSSFYLSLIPVFFLALGSLKYYKNFIKITLLTAAIGLICTVFISSFFTPIAMFIIALLILVLRYNRHIFNFKTIIYLFLCFIIGSSFYSNFISSTDVLAPIIERVEDLFSGDSRRIEARASHTEASFETFASNPFIGIGVPREHSYQLIGGHNFWVDSLAYFGFFGFLPFLIFLFVLMKNQIKHYYFRSDENIFFRTACFIGLVVFLTSNFVVPSITSQTMIVFVFFYFASFSNLVSNDHQSYDYN